MSFKAYCCIEGPAKYDYQSPVKSLAKDRGKPQSIRRSGKEKKKVGCRINMKLVSCVTSNGVIPLLKYNFLFTQFTQIGSQKLYHRVDSEHR